LQQGLQLLVQGVWAWQDMIKAMKALEIHESKTKDGETIN
jgi:hypothetical protein